MSTDRETARIVRSWLQTDENESADRVLDSVLDQLDTTPQRRATWWPVRRLEHMNTAMRLGIAAAVVAIAAVLGYSYFIAPNTGNERVNEPTSSSTPQSPPAEGLIDPGTYFMSDEEFTPAPFAFTVPAGWSIDTSGLIAKHLGEDGELGISSWDVTHVFAHACNHPNGSTADLIEVGPTVDELATALAAQEERATSGPTDDTVGGLPAKRVELEGPTDPAACPGLMRIWPDPGGDVSGGWRSRPGQSDAIYIVDVRGVRVVIATWHLPDATDEDLAELESILASIDFGS